MAKKISTIILLALSFGFAGVISADTLDMSEQDRASTFDQAGKPTRGMTQQSVEANFGAPQSALDAVGEPPISRWEYASFVVFFEYDRVIHAVSK
jgi:hypothetical protein